MSDPTKPVEIRDARALRALAHPLRLQLLDCLATEGTATATRCAELLGSSVANSSYHLRVLHRHGLVEPVPGVTRRDHPWQLSGNYRTIPVRDLAPGAGAAEQALLAAVLDHEVAYLQDWLLRRRDEPLEWREAGISSLAAWLTAEELHDLHERMQALVLDYLDRDRDPARRPAGARPVRMLLGLSIGSGPRPTPHNL
jgi:DNA-binding transcriptional ArsR family regulator